MIFKHFHGFWKISQSLRMVLNDPGSKWLPNPYIFLDSDGFEQLPGKHAFLATLPGVGLPSLVRTHRFSAALFTDAARMSVSTLPSAPQEKDASAREGITTARIICITCVEISVCAVEYLRCHNAM